MILSPEFSIGMLWVTFLAGLASVGFLWWLYYRDPDRPRSWLLWTLAITSTASQIGGWYLGWIAYIRITEGLAGVPPWTAPITTACVVMMTSLPVWLVVQFWRHSKR